MDFFAKKGINIGLSPGANSITVNQSVSHYMFYLNIILGGELKNQNKNNINKIYEILSTKEVSNKSQINRMMAEICAIVQA
jgi:hypothetical protein